MGLICLALGLVLIIEGLAYALAPRLVEDLLEAVRAFSPDQRRAFGLAALAIGVGLVWIARALGAI